MRVRVARNLVQQEKQESNDRRGISPPLPAEQRSHETDLDDAVPEQIDRAEGRDTGQEALGGMQKVVRHHVMRIFGQFVEGQDAGYVTQLIGADEEQQRATDNLERTIDALSDDANIEKQLDDVASRLRCHYCVARQAGRVPDAIRRTTVESLELRLMIESGAMR